MVSGISTFGGIRQQEKYQQLIHDIKSPIYGPRNSTNCTLIRTCDQRRINIVNSGLVNAFNGNQHSTLNQPINSSSSSGSGSNNNGANNNMFFLQQQQPQPQQQQQQQQQFIQYNNNNQYQQQQQYESIASTQQLRQLFC